MRNNQFGFAHYLLFILLIIIGAATFAGWKVYSTQSSSKTIPQSYKKIVAIGDISCPPDETTDSTHCQDKATFNQAKIFKPDAVLALGDLQYEDGALDKFQTSFAKTWGTYKNILYPAPGNHEYTSADASGYYSYFKDAPVDISKGYYAFKLGDWEIISMNSNCDKLGGCAADSVQIKWLDNQLNQSSAKCTLAFWHYPRFSSGKYFSDAATKNPSANMWTVLTAHKADVVLNGHDHIYERFAPQTSDGAASNVGLSEFVVGTGGKSLYEKNGTTPNSEKFINDKFGILAMKLYSNKYSWEFIDTGGQVLDSGTRSCNL